MKKLLTFLIMLVLAAGAGSVLAKDKGKDRDDDRGRSNDSRGKAGHQDDDDDWRHGKGLGHCKNKGKGHHKNKHHGWDHDCDDEEEPPVLTCTENVNREEFESSFNVLITYNPNGNQTASISVAGVDQIEYMGEVCSAEGDVPYLADEPYSISESGSYFDGEANWPWAVTVDLDCSVDMASVGDYEEDTGLGKFWYNLSVIKTCSVVSVQEE